MCANVYTSFPLESVILAGGRELVLGGLWLTPQGLQGYSASALCQILRPSLSFGDDPTVLGSQIKKDTVVAISWLFSAARTRMPQEPSELTCPLVLIL